MKWQKWIARLLLVATVGLVAGGYALFRQWTDPATVRAAVAAELAAQFPGADVQLGAAELRLLGGLELTNLELHRRGESNTPLAIIPAAVLRHDKEELTRGRLVIRKVELHAPQLTLVRHTNGTWNIAGLLGEPAGTRPAPVIEVQDGVLTIVDEAVAERRFEIRKVQLTAIPDATGRFRIEANGESELVGGIQLEGTAHPRTGELQLVAKLPAVAITHQLQATLEAYLTAARDATLEVEGTAAVEVELTRQPGATPSWAQLVKLTLRDGTLRYARFPIPLEDVSATAQWNGSRLVLESLQARSHGARVQVEGELSGLGADADLRLDIKAEHLQITRDIYDRLPPQIARMCADFTPQGSLSLTSSVRQRNGKLTANYTATLEGVSILYKEFPYPVSGVTGTLAYQEDGEVPELAVHVAGIAGRRPVKMTGRVYGPGLQPGVAARPGIELDITGENLPIDEPFVAALPQVSQLVARQFQPAGLVDVRAELRRRPGSQATLRMPMVQRYVLHFHEARMRYEKFPYPVEEVEGTLDLIPGERWTFTGFRGKHKGALFAGSASSAPSAAGDHIVVNVRGANALLDPEMEAALISAKMKHAYRLFSPEGRVDFTAKVDIVGKQEPALDLLLTARNCSMKPTCFPYQLNDVQGTFHYVKDRVTLAEFRARHGQADVTLGRNGEGGTVELRPNNGFRARLWQLHAEPLPVDEQLLVALPRLVRHAFSTLKPDKPVRIITDLTIDDPGKGGPVRYDWDGHVAFADTTLRCGFPLTHVTGLVACRGKHDGTNLDAEGRLEFNQMAIGAQVFRDVQSELKLTQHSLVFPGLHAAVHGGEIYGPLRVDFIPEVSYRVDLTGSQIDLEKFARETLGRAGQVKGKASARLELRGKGDDLSTLRGAGSVRIADGRLYDLPLILDLLSTLSGHLPKGSAFQEANADFTIDGDRLRVAKLQFIGDALTLEGQGDMRVDGSDVRLEMYGLLWGRTIPLLPAIIDQIPSWLSKRLMKIRLEGDLAKVNTKLEPVPVLVEPVKALLKSAASRQRMDEQGLRRMP